MFSVINSFIISSYTDHPHRQGEEPTVKGAYMSIKGELK
jgi:hypothetical protein